MAGSPQHPANPTEVSTVGGLRVIATPGFSDYALLDSGQGRKLERFGRFTVDRPEPQAMWQRLLEPSAWLRADAVFKGSGNGDEEDGGRWRKATAIPESWSVHVQGATLLCRLTSFRHLGVFPEQLPHWQWMLEVLRGIRSGQPRVLNLFAYTGVASLLAASAGAEVTHVDASKKAIAWAKENRALSKLDDASIRWIVEDARKFLAREVRRGRSYHFILVDPPKFGRGPEGEVWEIFEHLAPLLRDCAALLAKPRSALVLSTYAIRASALAMEGLARECFAACGGTTDSGELALIEHSGGRLLPTSMYTRWSSE